MEILIWRSKDFNIGGYFAIWGEGYYCVNIYLGYFNILITINYKDRWFSYGRNLNKDKD